MYLSYMNFNFFNSRVMLVMQINLYMIKLHIADTELHGSIESLRLEKTFKVIKSNHNVLDTSILL